MQAGQPDFEQQIRIETGRSEQGTFVRVRHLPSGRCLTEDPIGEVRPAQVAATLAARLRMLVAADLERAVAEADWPPPWQPVADGAGLVGELRREMGPQHPLSGQALRAVARRGDGDDVLFAVGEPLSCLAQVHLTWSKRREPDAAFPGATWYSSVDEFLQG